MRPEEPAARVLSAGDVRAALHVPTTSPEAEAGVKSPLGDLAYIYNNPDPTLYALQAMPGLQVGMKMYVDGKPHAVVTEVGAVHDDFDERGWPCLIGHAVLERIPLLCRGDQA